MKKSKAQQGTKNIEDLTKPNSDCEDLHKQKPESSVPSANIDSDTEEETVDQERRIIKPRKNDDSGFDEWSVSWP